MRRGLCARPLLVRRVQLRFFPSAALSGASKTTEQLTDLPGKSCATTDLPGKAGRNLIQGGCATTDLPGRNLIQGGCVLDVPEFTLIMRMPAFGTKVALAVLEELGTKSALVEIRLRNKLGHIMSEFAGQATRTLSQNVEAAHLRVHEVLRRLAGKSAPASHCLVEATCLVVSSRAWMAWETTVQ